MATTKGTSKQRAAEQDDVMGPIGYLLVEYPGNKMTGEGLTALVDLVDRGLIRVLDLVFIRKDEDGTVSVLELEDFGEGGDPSLTIFAGASSGLLRDDDITESGSALEPGSSAAMLLYENRWAAPFAAALRSSGARLVSAGIIPQDDIIIALDELEAEEARS